ncbi:helix-turn-helix domain-containing protein [Halobacillus litoralis]|uniref:helix-turn-helix domain-containing protein n=1 Tax=Halobacillus litoralis TaxID=45668 RepID=UPI001CD209CA|nr:helix-turn-helix domain-containing protein [Halobacillus litoralis]MCA0972178.1 helix-turn-helix domain-containing protein [Halobacillus litoralis]
MNSKADMILHPVRMKIIQCLARGPATVQDLRESLKEIPQATLYRHLQALSENDIINVIEERQVRGAVEKTYSIEKDAAHFSAEEAEKLTTDEHMEMFMMYMAIIMRDMEAYLEGETRMGEDLFGYNQLDLYVSDEESTQLQKDINNLLHSYAQNKASVDRRRVSLSTILVPEKKERGDHREK